MANYFLQMQQPRARNSLLDFSPINNGINAIGEAQQQQTRNAMMQQQMDMQREQHASQQARYAKQDARADRDDLSKAVLGVYNMPAGPQQDAAWQHIMGRFNVQGLSEQERNLKTGLPMLMAELGVTPDPMAGEERRLRLQNTRSEIALKDLQMQGIRDERAQMTELRNMLYGDQSSAEQSAPHAVDVPQRDAGSPAAPQIAQAGAAPAADAPDAVRVGNRTMTRDQATSFAEALLLNPKTKDSGAAILKRLAAGGGSMGFGEKQVDKEFAKDYNEFIAQGGFADMKKNLQQLGLVQKELLEGKKNLTGPLLGLMPDAITSFTNPDAVDRRELVEEVVQRNLRLILGAQFTQREGDRLIARAYNPRLEEKQNAQRIGRLMGAMRKAMAAKLAAAEYYERNGTLKGFKGRQQFSVDDIMSDAGLSDVGDHGLRPGDVQDGYRFKGGDPAMQSNWEKI